MDGDIMIYVKENNLNIAKDGERLVKEVKDVNGIKLYKLVKDKNTDKMKLFGGDTNESND